jgi:hypothetical protein
MARETVDEKVRTGLETVVLWCDMWQVLNRLLKALSDGTIEDRQDDVTEFTRLCNNYMKMSKQAYDNSHRRN